MTAVSGNFSDMSVLNLAQSPNHAFASQNSMPQEWLGTATIEVYMISDASINVGYVTGSMMYDLIQRTLKADCPYTIGNRNNKKCQKQWRPFDTRYKDSQGRIKGMIISLMISVSNT